MPRPTDSHGDELKPVALYYSGGSAIGPSGALIVNGLAIRDTLVRDFLASVSGFTRKVFAFINTLDQPLQVSLGFSTDGGSIANGALFVSGISIPAGSVRYVGPEGASNAGFIAEPRLANYAESVYASIQCTIAPTSGSCSIYVLRNVL